MSLSKTRRDYKRRVVAEQKEKTWMGTLVEKIGKITIPQDKRRWRHLKRSLVSKTGKGE